MFIVATRVLAVSAWSGTTATAVLAAQGTGSVVVGAMLDSWPAMAMLVVLFGIVAFATNPRGNSAPRWAVAAAALIAALFVMPWTFALIAVVAWGAVKGFDRMRRVSRTEQQKKAPPWGLTGIVVLLAAVVFAVSPVPWLPAETFTVDGTDDEQLVGYVLGEDGEDLLILRDRDRRVLRVPLSEIEDRRFCLAAKESPSSYLWKESRRLLVPAFALTATDGAPGYAACGGDLT